MSAEIQRTIEELGRSWEQFKANNEDQIKAVSKGVSASVYEEKAAKLNDRISELQTLLDQQQKNFDEAIAKFSRPGAGEEKGGRSEHEKAFLGWMRKGEGKLSADEVKAMSVSSDPDGGYLVPVDMSGRIIAKLYETSPIRAIASVDSTSSDAVEGLVDNDEVTTGWVGETATRSETDTAELGKWRIEVHEQYAEPRITQKLLDDSAIDVGSWLERKIVDKLTRTENAAFVTGNGIGKPRGFAGGYSTAATGDGSRAWGVLEHIASGASGDFTGTNPADKLLDMVYALKSGYRTGARWVTKRTVMLKIRKFKEATTNAYIWQPGLTAGQPALILGFPTTEAEDMPALAGDSLSLAFGNFGVGYQIYDRLGIRVLRDNLTTKGYVKFYATKRVGGGVVNFEAIKLMKFANS
jgi:HK97 family phage major capsid protein